MARNDVVEVWSPVGAAPDVALVADLRFPLRATRDSLRVAYVDNVKPNTAELMQLIDRRMIEAHLGKGVAIPAERILENRIERNLRALALKHVARVEYPGYLQRHDQRSGTG